MEMVARVNIIPRNEKIERFRYWFREEDFSELALVSNLGKSGMRRNMRKATMKAGIG